MAKEKIETFLEKITRELLTLLGIKAELEIIKEEELITVQIQTEEPGLLIGYHGQALNALQRLLSLVLYHQKEEWVKLLVNVNDYRQKRREALEKMAFSVAQKVKFYGEVQTLPPMSSFERRIIHLVLAGDSEVETDSEGEGDQRRVTIRPKSMDGDDPPTGEARK